MLFVDYFDQFSSTVLYDAIFPSKKEGAAILFMLVVKSYVGTERQTLSMHEKHSILISR